MSYKNSGQRICAWAKFDYCFVEQRYILPKFDIIVVKAETSLKRERLSIPAAISYFKTTEDTHDSVFACQRKDGTLSCTNN